MAYKNKYLILTILAIFYLFMRLGVLITSMDKVYLDEELYRGNIAKELISGPILPFFDYQRSEYEGGSLVAGLMAVPFFLLFGKTLFSLKLVALSFSIATIIAWYLFLEKFFHRRAAILATLLWIFSPPFYTKMSLFTSGSYFETSLFTILAVFIFYQAFFIQQKKWLFAVLGLISGFALFFSYIFSVTLFILLLFWFIFDKKFIFSRGFFIFALFFLLGFSPWIYYNLTHNFEGLIVADKPILHWFTKNSLGDSLLRIKDIFAFEIANSFGFQDTGFISRRFISAFYYGAFALSFCGLLVIHGKSLLKFAGGIIPYRRFAVIPKEMPRVVPLIMFFIIFCIILAFSGFEFRADFYEGYLHRYRYFIPVYPFMLALIAVFCHKMTSQPRPVFTSYASSALMPALIVVGLACNLNLVSVGNFGRAFISKIYQGYNYYDLGKIICWRFSDAGESVVLIKGIKNEIDRRHCYAGMGWGFGKGKFKADYNFYIRNILPGIDKKYWPNACKRIGEVTGYNDKIAKDLEHDPGAPYWSYFYLGAGAKEAKMLVRSPAAYARLAEEIHAKYQPYFHEGMGIELFEILTDDTEVFLDFTRRIDKRLIPALYKGLSEGKEYYQFNYDRFGFGIGRVGYDIEKWNKIINNIPDEYRPYCYQRLGIEIGWRFIHDIKRYQEFLQKADKKYSSSLYQGLGTGIGWRFGYDLAGCRQIIQQIDPQYRAYAYAGLETGLARQEGMI